MKSLLPLKREQVSSLSKKEKFQQRKGERDLSRPPLEPLYGTLATSAAAAVVIIAAAAIAAATEAPTAAAAAQDDDNQQNPQTSSTAKAAEATTVIAPHYEVPPDQNGSRLIASPIPSYAQEVLRFLTFPEKIPSAKWRPLCSGPWGHLQKCGGPSWGSDRPPGQ